MRNLHDELVLNLVDRLKEGGLYDAIGMNVPYNQKHGIGEVDVLTYNSGKKTYHFYEVKVNYKLTNFLSGLKQYRKYCNAFPDRNIKGIFVSNQRVRRFER